MTIGVLFLVASCLFFNQVTAQLPIEALYNFGASGADTGGYPATFGPLTWPFGATYFGKPERYTDGRLIVDFFTEYQGFPYLSPYLDSIGTEFSRGANFAASGSTIQALTVELFNRGTSPISLHVQLYQFQRFKARCLEFHSQGRSNNSKILLPKPESFSRALYMFDNGQNDLEAGLEIMGEEEVIATIPSMIGNFSVVLEKLYLEGARYFWINNVGPMGCYPWFLISHPHVPENRDPNGCIVSYNNVAKEFNKQLANRTHELSNRFGDAIFTIVDMYSIKYALTSHAEELGFINPLGYCCGDLEKVPPVGCGEARTRLCENPLRYISWDGVHYTDAANKWVFDQILSGSFTKPKFPWLNTVNYDK